MGHAPLRDLGSEQALLVPSPPTASASSEQPSDTSAPGRVDCKLTIRKAWKSEGTFCFSFCTEKPHLPLKDRLWQEVCASDWPPSKEVLRVSSHPKLLFLFKPLQDTSAGEGRIKLSA